VNVLKKENNMDFIKEFMSSSWPVFFCLYSVHQIEILDWLAEKIARILP
tara:strand:- start:81 stop:227 length:147 start_codon:yes stop_codon:yes gene_type:complete